MAGPEPTKAQRLHDAVLDSCRHLTASEILDLCDALHSLIRARGAAAGEGHRKLSPVVRPWRLAGRFASRSL